MTNSQIECLRDEAVRAGDAGIAQACRAALRDVPGEPWVAAAARTRCERVVARAIRDGGMVNGDEWCLSDAALDALRVQS